MHPRKILIMLTALSPIAAVPVFAAQDNKSTSEQRTDLTRRTPTGGTIGGTATPNPQAAGTQGVSGQGGSGMNSGTAHATDSGAATKRQGSSGGGQ